MIKFFPLFYNFAILLILNTSGKVNGTQCEEKIGICDKDYNSKCEVSKNGKGMCEKLSQNDVGTCKCLYECNDNGNGNGNGNVSRKNKKCNGGIGLCSEQCDESCCERNCAIKYPGPLGGYGFCMNIVGAPAPYECICYFNC
ncbi:hypothetical protein E1A91_A08G025300v1 [Gossypium mustelinum]|uniref:Defensin-like protein n=1 Tax=Gossypium mustelinum TaxID=34275 RepID=A0A5D2Y384_GOSMU|nr:hypothetical protein E1A91_A08G025300v1 [Gossypium mustelinum]